MTTRGGTRAQYGVGGGMGLGLFIAKTLLERSGAALKMENAPEGGAIVDNHMASSGVRAWRSVSKNADRARISTLSAENALKNDSA